MKAETIQKIQKAVVRLLDDTAILGISFVVIYLGAWALEADDHVVQRVDPARACWAVFGAFIVWLFSETFNAKENGKKWDGSDSDED